MVPWEDNRGQSHPSLGISGDGVALYIFQCQDVDGVTVLRFQYHWVGHLRIFGALPRYCFYPMYSSNELCAYVS